MGLEWIPFNLRMGFELFLAVIIIIWLVLWVQIRWGRVKRYWAERGVPHYPPHPIMGSLTFLQKQNPAIWMRKLYNDFRSPYVGMWLFWRPALVVNCPDIARRVLVKDADIFRNRFLGSGKSDPIGSLNLFTVDDPIWTSIRRRLTPVFTASKLRALEGLTSAKATELTDRINCELLKENNSIHLRELYSDYTSDVIGESAFGVICEATRTGDSAIRKVTRDFMKYDMVRGLAWSSIFFIPKLVDIFRFSFFPKHTIKYLRQVFRSVVVQRGGYDKNINEVKDLLDALLKIRQEAALDSEEISEDLLLSQAAVFVQAGFDTSSTALTYLTYELAFHPHLQERLHQEILEAKQQIGDNNFDAETLAELPYLNAMIKETTRKYPVMGWLDRVALKNYQVDEKLTISAGTIVYVNAVAMHYDPEYFPEPEKFDPDRFLPENLNNIRPYTFMPFGEGPRNCIGKRFAYQSMRFAVASVFLNYQVSPLPDSLEPNDCPIERKGMFLAPAESLSVVFTRRK